MNPLTRHHHSIQMGPPSRDKTIRTSESNRNESESLKYLDELHQCTTPWFTVCAVTLEIVFFVYLANQAASASDTSAINLVARESIFIYRPDARKQVWRFVTYCLIHANWMHLIFNLIFQVALGVALEYVHGSGRVAIIFLAGVLAGSLATSVFSPRSMLIGVSSGLYAILAGHLVNLLLNYHRMKWAPLWLTGIFLCALFDFAFALYDKYNSQPDKSPISFTAHLAGTICGLAVGLIVLKQFQEKERNQLIWWCSLGVTCSLYLAALLYNLMHPQIV